MTTIPFEYEILVADEEVGKIAARYFWQGEEYVIEVPMPTGTPWTVENVEHGILIGVGAVEDMKRQRAIPKPKRADGVETMTGRRSLTYTEYPQRFSLPDKPHIDPRKQKLIPSRHYATPENPHYWAIEPKTAEEQAAYATTFAKSFVVSMRQARIALARRGDLSRVEAAVQAAGQEAQIEWEYAHILNRNSDIVANIGAVLGYTDEELDDLFVEASHI